MARRVFFSFHYASDIFRINQIRNSWVTKEDAQKGFFWDSSLWEATKKRGDRALKQMIDEGLEKATITAVLAGAQTFNRRWVRYELIQSFFKSNGMLTIDLSGMQNSASIPSAKGPNPLDYIYIRSSKADQRVYCWELGENGEWISPRDAPHWQSFSGFRYNVSQELDSKMSTYFRSYRWLDGGYEKFDSWIEIAAKPVNR